MSRQTLPKIIKTSIVEHPVLSVITLAIVFLFVQYLPLFVLPMISGFAQKFIGKVLISILAIWLITTLDWWKEAGFATPSHWQMWKPFLPLFILPVLSALVSDFTLTNPWQIGLITIYVITVGFAEEALVRGIFLRAIKPKGVLKAALLSSLIFGLMHFANLLMGADLGNTLTQVIYATLIGIAFSGTLIYTGSIYPLIIIHTLVDLFPRLEDVSEVSRSISLTNALIMIGVQIPFAIYGFWLLRQRMKSTIKQTQK
jgi:membrane protease YdiL (CAAX protease family)